MNGKGSANTRDYDRRKYWDSPLWKQKKKNQVLWDENEAERKRMGIVVVDTDKDNIHQILLEGDWPDETPLYQLAIKYEYLCERFDRGLHGRFNKHNEWIPYNNVECSSNARYHFSRITSSSEARENNIKGSDIKRMCNTFRNDYTWLKSEYERIFGKMGIVVNNGDEDYE